MYELTIHQLMRAAMVFLMAGSVTGVLAGAMLMIWPHGFKTINHLGNRPLDLDWAPNLPFDPWFYRYRRWGAAAVLTGALFMLYFFSVLLDRADVLGGLAQRFHYPDFLLEWMLDASVLAGILGGLFACFISLFLLLRPSLLRDFERRANQWWSVPDVARQLNAANHQVDDYVLRHGRRVGFYLLSGSLYASFGLLYWFELTGKLPH